MIVKFSDKFVEAKPQVFDYADDLLIHKFVYYIIDSKYRKSVKLVDWLKMQIVDPVDSLVSCADSIKNFEG